MINVHALLNLMENIGTVLRCTDQHVSHAHIQTTKTNPLLIEFGLSSIRGDSVPCGVGTGDLTERASGGFISPWVGCRLEGLSAAASYRQISVDHLFFLLSSSPWGGSTLQPTFGMLMFGLFVRL